MFYYDRMTRLLAIYIHIHNCTKHRATGVHVRTEYIAVSTGDRPTEVDDLIHPIFFRRIYYAQKLFRKTLMHIYLLWLYIYVRTMFVPSFDFRLTYLPPCAIS